MDKLQEFKKYLIDNYKSSKTIDAYILDIRQFLQYNKKPLSKTKNVDIERYKEYMLYNKKLSPISVNRKLVSINQFLLYFQVPISTRQVKIHSQNFLDDIFDKEDIESLLKITEMNGDLRAKALISTMQLTGMRISEVLQLNIKDINKDTILILGKGSKRRSVFIPKKLRDIWKEYSLVRINKTDKLFTGQKGAITRFTAHKIVKQYAKLANVDNKKAHCHNFRHHYCKTLADKGLSINVIADLAGHTDINTTRIYTRKSKKELLEIINDLD
ncbi:tyrosine recombinase XerC (plasmid) [Clostridium tetani]|uniref:tyrosine-type recombinase/integrase n=1 Tax=Clostridium tetani TaxID=1513 RepID=UPI0029532AD2|nr:tyrosine-type recombinase/integrase [Clostridium tetani]BDR74207.1 tyrosine recombinase XerC [Clostridium tetani]